LIQEAQQHQIPDVESHLCFQMLSLTATINRNCATLMLSYNYSKGNSCCYF